MINWNKVAILIETLQKETGTEGNATLVINTEEGHAVIITSADLGNNMAPIVPIGKKEDL